MGYACRTEYIAIVKHIHAIELLKFDSKAILGGFHRDSPSQLQPNRL